MYFFLFNEIYIHKFLSNSVTPFTFCHYQTDNLRFFAEPFFSRCFLKHSKQYFERVLVLIVYIVPKLSSILKPRTDFISVTVSSQWD